MKRLATILLPATLAVASIAFAQQQGSNLRSQLSIDNAAPERTSELSGYANVVEKVSPSVVTIISIVKGKAAPAGAGPEDFFNDPLFRRFFGDQFDHPGQGRGRQPQQMPRQQGQGSGVILTQDGYIATNNHVIDGATDIQVVLPGKAGEYKAKVIGRDPATDIALLKVDAKNLPAATLADSAKLKVGDTVLAIGNPFGLDQTVTTGIVSALNRKNMNIAGYENFIQTDASINPGNSGGALIDHQGRVVGINTAIFSRSGGNMGIGFAIPINMVVDITDRLVADGSIQRGYLGVMLAELTPDLAAGFGTDTNGVLVNQVMEDTPASKAGFQDGDVIRSYQGTPVSDMSDLRMLVANTKPGEKAAFGILRDGKEQTLNVTIGKLPDDGKIAANTPSSEEESTPAAQKFLDGVEVASLNSAMREQYGISQEATGVVVTKVDPGSNAAEEGLRVGDVISTVARQEVKSPADAVAALKAAKGNVVLLRVLNQQGARFLAVTR